MKQQLLRVGKIEVGISGLFTTHHSLDTEAGSLGELTFPAFSQGAVYHTPGGRELQMEKPRWLGTTHELWEGETLRGSANQAGLLRQDLEIQFGGGAYSLAPRGLLDQGWTLTDQGGTVLLEIEPRGIFRQGAFVTIHNPVDMDLVVFAYYLYYVRLQENSAVVAATTAS
jgi:hypothetical protein